MNICIPHLIEKLRKFTIQGLLVKKIRGIHVLKKEEPAVTSASHF